MDDTLTGVTAMIVVIWLVDRSAVLNEKLKLSFSIELCGISTTFETCVWSWKRFEQQNKKSTSRSDSRVCVQCFPTDHNRLRSQSKNIRKAQQRPLNNTRRTHIHTQHRKELLKNQNTRKHLTLPRPPPPPPSWQDERWKILREKKKKKCCCCCFFLFFFSWLFWWRWCVGSRVQTKMFFFKRNESQWRVKCLCGGLDYENGLDAVIICVG